MAKFVNSCHPPWVSWEGRGGSEGEGESWRVVEEALCWLMAHLHAVEGCNSHVEEDTVEHGHGNELWEEEQERPGEQPPRMPRTINTWWDNIPSMSSIQTAPMSGQHRGMKPYKQ